MAGATCHARVYALNIPKRVNASVRQYRNFLAQVHKRHRMLKNSLLSVSFRSLAFVFL